MSENPSVFPVKPSQVHEMLDDGSIRMNVTTGTSGLSLRDWFAGQALAGICAFRGQYQMPKQEFAQEAYWLADAMLAARKTTSKE